MKAVIEVLVEIAVMANLIRVMTLVFLLYSGQAKSDGRNYLVEYFLLLSATFVALGFHVHATPADKILIYVFLFTETGVWLAGWLIALVAKRHDEKHPPGSDRLWKVL